VSLLRQAFQQEAAEPATQSAPKDKQGYPCAGRHGMCA
jgi:hypothetical protein